MGAVPFQTNFLVIQKLSLYCYLENGNIAKSICRNEAKLGLISGQKFSFF